MPQRVTIYLNNRGAGRNQLKKKSEDRYELFIGSEGFDPMSRSDQFWLMDELKRSGQEVPNERTLQHEISKINKNLSGTAYLSVE